MKPTGLLAWKHPGTDDLAVKQRAKDLIQLAQLHGARTTIVTVEELQALLALAERSHD